MTRFTYILDELTPDASNAITSYLFGDVNAYGSLLISTVCPLLRRSFIELPIICALVQRSAITIYAAHITIIVSAISFAIR